MRTRGGISDYPVRCSPAAAAAAETYRKFVNWALVSDRLGTVGK